MVEKACPYATTALLPDYGPQNRVHTEQPAQSGCTPTWMNTINPVIYLQAIISLRNIKRV